MKNILLLFLTLSAYSLAAQQILSVRQGFDDGVTTFSDLQSAVDAASNGTVILVYPGIYNGDVLVSKPVRIVGTGYLQGLNYPNTTFLSGSRINSTLVVDNLGAGTSIESLHIQRLDVINATDINVYRCNIKQSLIEDSNNVLVSQSLFDGESRLASGDMANLLNGTCQVMFNNCIFKADNGNATGALSSRGADGAVTNTFVLEFNYCSFVGSINLVGGSTGSMALSTFNNCIFSKSSSAIIHRIWAPNPEDVFFNNCVFTSDYEETGSVVIGDSTNNILGISPSSIFVGYPLLQEDYTFDSRFQVSPTSAAFNYASDGGACGAFGGEFPYVPSGLPRGPFIYSLDVPQEASTGGGAEINVKVRTQN